jgi:hypothetical protein
MNFAELASKPAPALAGAGLIGGELRPPERVA